MLTLPPLTTLVPSRLDTTITDFRARIDQTSQEAVTGLREDLVSHLKGDVGTAMLSKRALDHLETERSQLNLRKARLALTEQSLTFIKDASEGVGPQMLTAIGAGDEAGQSVLAQEAVTRLDQVLTSLNTRQGSRFLFAGDATTTQPVPSASEVMDQLSVVAAGATNESDLNAALNTFFDDPSGAWQTGIFAGTPQSSDPDSIIAIDPAITNVVKSLATLALSGPEQSPATQDLASGLRQSAALSLTQSTSDIVGLLSNVGLNQSKVDDRLDALNSEETVLNSALNEIIGRDQYEAVTELQRLESNLEAAYLVTSRLSDLTLLNYIR